MSDEAPRSNAKAARKTGGNVQLALGALLLAVAGYLVGARGTFKPAPNTTALARLGYALEAEQLSGDDRDWAALEKDAQAALAATEDRLRLPLEIVIALRGLENRGQPQWERARQLCGQLQWPRCDREALQSIQKRSRP